MSGLAGHGHDTGLSVRQLYKDTMSVPITSQYPDINLDTSPDMNLDVTRTQNSTNQASFVINCYLLATFKATFNNYFGMQVKYIVPQASAVTCSIKLT